MSSGLSQRPANGEREPPAKAEEAKGYQGPRAAAEDPALTASGTLHGGFTPCVSHTGAFNAGQLLLPPASRAAQPPLRRAGCCSRWGVVAVQRCQEDPGPGTISELLARRTEGLVQGTAHRGFSAPRASGLRRGNTRYRAPFPQEVLQDKHTRTFSPSDLCQDGYMEKGPREYLGHLQRGRLWPCDQRTCLSNCGI